MRLTFLLAGCLTAAALSLLAPWALAFDPYAWLIWGREIAHGTLDTSAGPSFKPGTVLVTLPLSLLGDSAPAAWLVLARTGALLALAGAATVAGQLRPGRLAPICAVLVLALSPWWFFNAALGNSEGWLAASVLWAAAAHLAGRRRLALLALLGGSLLRPEIWPFLAGYGLWLGWEDRSAWPGVGGAGVLVVLAWFVPGAVGGGGASGAARGVPSAGSAALADVPLLAVLGDAVELLTLPVAIALVLIARKRTRPRAALPLLAAALAYVGLVAAMTQLGYSGNPRYLVPAVALLAVLAVVAAPRLAPVVVLATAAVTAGGLLDQAHDVGVRSDSRRSLVTLLSVTQPHCAVVRTSVAQRTTVAWELKRSLDALDSPPRAPASVLQAVPYAGGAPEPKVDVPPFVPLVRVGSWTLSEAGCAG